MALGGVALGSMKAQLHASVAGSNPRLVSVLPKVCARMGSAMEERATLDTISVMNVFEGLGEEMMIPRKEIEREGQGINVSECVRACMISGGTVHTLDCYAPKSAPPKIPNGREDLSFC